MFGLRLGVCLSWPGFNDDAAVDAVPDVDSASFSLGWLLFPLPSPYPTPSLPTTRLTLSALSVAVATVWKLSKLN